ncbi:hypothetical protein JOD29_000610 [Lysinibacillus composti]|nr:hypothetical protein [Lysinibacillus composti]MBM7607373.1 hypothetical protein [Lysinibacillus composti]
MRRKISIVLVMNSAVWIFSMDVVENILMIVATNERISTIVEKNVHIA